MHFIAQCLCEVHTILIISMHFSSVSNIPHTISMKTQCSCFGLTIRFIFGFLCKVVWLPNICQTIYQYCGKQPQQRVIMNIHNEHIIPLWLIFHSIIVSWVGLDFLQHVVWDTRSNELIFLALFSLTLTLFLLHIHTHTNVINLMTSIGLYVQVSPNWSRWN